MPEWNDRNRPLYMIGVAAELAGVHPQTLRAYEQKGLVTPQRTSGNTRMYSIRKSTTCTSGSAALPIACMSWKRVKA